jgi:hypothetical protein
MNKSLSESIQNGIYWSKTISRLEYDPVHKLIMKALYQPPFFPDVSTLTL